MTEPRPFDDTQWTLGGLTLDSAADRVAVYGSVDLTADEAGLAQARRLAAYFQAVVAYLEQAKAEGALPQSIEPAPLSNGPNPFD